MSVMTISPMGRISPMGQTVQADITEVMEDQYFALRERCIERWGEDFCNSVLPRNMVYAVTRRGEGYTLPWWAWMALGALMVKLLRL